MRRWRSGTVGDCNVPGPVVQRGWGAPVSARGRTWVSSGVDTACPMCHVDPPGAGLVLSGCDGGGCGAGRPRGGHDLVRGESGVGDPRRRRHGGHVDSGRRELPTSPTIVLAPVLVMPEPASTANCPAVPNGTTVAAAWALPADTNAARAATDTPPYRTSSGRRWRCMPQPRRIAIVVSRQSPTSASHSIV